MTFISPDFKTEKQENIKIGLLGIEKGKNNSDFQVIDNYIELDSNFQSQDGNDEFRFVKLPKDYKDRIVLSQVLNKEKLPTQKYWVLRNDGTISKEYLNSQSL